MKPKLIAISGPAEGVHFVLAESETKIGRDPKNRICLDDLSVSRHHCSILGTNGQYQLVDRGSLNNTFVNGIPIKEHQLRSGDRIRAGDSLLLFLLDEEVDGAVSTPTQLTEARLITKHTVQLRKDSATLFQTTETPVLTPVTSRSTRDLNALLKISLAVNSIRTLEAFQQHLLPPIFEVIPASRGVILLTEEKTGEISSIFSRHRVSSDVEPIQVSRKITERLLKQGIALLSNDVRQNLSLRDGHTESLYQVRAVLAVPMLVSGRVLGLIYLDTPDPAVRFDEDHLQLMRAIAAIATVALENIRQVSQLESENRRLQAEIAIEHDMVGQSPRMRDVYQFITKVAATGSTVLIRGESGTGKELAARAIHGNSTRSSRPFVAINCAALTETLLESELFGHEKGAFTGAIALKKGKLELAEGGTVFLDEIGEMALTIQSKLLRVLQEHEFERVGGTRTIKTDIRLIAATNKNLEQAIKDGSFREDLYYRLNVLRLDLPPLRDRREDILPLAHYFTTKYGQRCNRKVSKIAPEAMACLNSYHWPGNVREFENAIERAIVLGSTETIRAEDLPESVIMTGPPRSAGGEKEAQDFYSDVKEAKKRLIMKAVEQAQGNYTEAARLLGVHANHLHRLIRNLGMKAELKK